MPLKCTVEMGIKTSQNMPQTSNSILLPTKSGATNGNQGQTVMDLRSSKTIDLPETSNSLLSPLN